MNDKLSYEMYRLQMLSSIITQCSVVPTKPEGWDPYYNDWKRYKSLAFALTHRMFPYFEPSNKRLHKYFWYSIYDIDKDYLKSVYDFLDKKEEEYTLNENKKPMSFYELENVFGYSENDDKLLLALQYAKVSRRYIFIISMFERQKDLRDDVKFFLNKADFEISDINLV